MKKKRNILLQTPIKYVFFEGVDKVGKTTLKRRFSEEFTQEFAAFDRSIVSNIVYDAIFNRESKFSFDDLLYFKDKAIFIYVKNTDKEKHKQILQKTQEKLANFDLHNEEFEKIFNYMKENGYNIIEIDTKKTEDDSFEELLIKIGEVIKNEQN